MTNYQIPDVSKRKEHFLYRLATNISEPGKGSVERKREQLLLALEWNRVDIAKQFIMTNDEDWLKINLNALFLTALERNQPAFVRLFLDHDFSLTVLFHDNSNLLDLYTKMDFQINPQSTDPLRTIYSQCLKPQIGDFFEIEAVLKPYTSEHDNYDNSVNCACLTTSTYMDVDKELFIWSVLSGKHEFAMLFWSRSKNKICAALLAVRLYTVRKEIDPIFLEYAKEFEKLAVNVLDLFYKQNPIECKSAITRQIPAFGNVAWIQMAVCAEAKFFIAHKAVQDVLNDIWYGGIDTEKCSDGTIILSSFMLLLSGFYLKYHDDSKKFDSNRPNVLFLNYLTHN
ncbi:unnamed protein product [Didymodactylos carnosus]|uniref:TRPM-like domain-containing protein n=1 Tax=Didymodactylos carnosus TaxID=1234261 RepID=A0A8S2FW05_9BILA|nr:unnamed protein product [Didymodactylos carnosus]CAF4367699.1 unnamed protein product [Didymodactylos carnosus]